MVRVAASRIDDLTQLLAEIKAASGYDHAEAAGTLKARKRGTRAGQRKNRDKAGRFTRANAPTDNPRNGESGVEPGTEVQADPSFTGAEQVVAAVRRRSRKTGKKRGWRGYMARTCMAAETRGWAAETGAEGAVVESRRGDPRGTTPRGEGWRKRLRRTEARAHAAEAEVRELKWELRGAKSREEAADRDVGAAVDKSIQAHAEVEWLRAEVACAWAEAEAALQGSEERATSAMSVLRSANASELHTGL